MVPSIGKKSKQAASRLTPSLSIGKNRADAVKRGVLGGLYYLVAFIFGWLFLLIYGGIWLVDISLTFVTNGDGLGDDHLGARMFDRQTRFREWALFGKGDAPDSRWRR